MLTFVAAALSNVSPVLPSVRVQRNTVLRDLRSFKRAVRNQDEALCLFHDSSRDLACPATWIMLTILRALIPVDLLLCQLMYRSVERARIERPSCR